IIADNTLWSGKVTENCSDAQTEGIRSFNDLVASDPAVEKVILPLRDGMTLIRKL
ncbi:MAG: methyltransferase, partial [Muribaculaceae bacterium]|nr:methyltransferase [Muribaculaceae bacterium]